MDGPVDMEQKGHELVQYQIHYMTLSFDPTHDFDLDFQGWILKWLCLMNGWVWFISIHVYKSCKQWCGTEWKNICIVFSKGVDEVS